MANEILAENIAFDENGLYIPQTWLDGVGEENFTPMTADRMNHIEQGIKGLSDAWDSQLQEWLWQSQQYPNYGILATRWGRVVIIHINLVNIGIQVTSEGTTLCTIPEHLRPLATRTVDAILYSSTLTSGSIRVAADGRLLGYSDTASTRYFCGTIMYLV